MSRVLGQMQNWKNKSFTMSACKPNNKNSNSLDFDQDLTHCTHTLILSGILNLNLVM